MIRDSIKNEILNSLNFSAFRMEDFLISYPYAENIYRIIIDCHHYATTAKGFIGFYGH